MAQIYGFEGGGGLPVAQTFSAKRSLSSSSGAASEFRRSLPFDHNGWAGGRSADVPACIGSTAEWGSPRIRLPHYKAQVAQLNEHATTDSLRIASEELLERLICRIVQNGEFYSKLGYSAVRVSKDELTILMTKDLSIQSNCPIVT